MVVYLEITKSAEEPLSEGRSVVPWRKAIPSVEPLELFSTGSLKAEASTLGREAPQQGELNACELSFMVLSYYLSTSERHRVEPSGQHLGHPAKTSAFYFLKASRAPLPVRRDLLAPPWCLHPQHPPRAFAAP